jgi:hypothetical protein
MVDYVVLKSSLDSKIGISAENDAAALEEAALILLEGERADIWRGCVFIGSILSPVQPATSANVDDIIPGVRPHIEKVKDAHARDFAIELLRRPG